MADENISLSDMLSGLQDLLKSGATLDEIKSKTIDVIGKYLDFKDVQEMVLEGADKLSDKITKLTGIDLSGFFSDASNNLSVLTKRFDEGSLSLAGFAAGAALVLPSTVRMFEHFDKFGGVGADVAGMSGQMAVFSKNITDVGVSMGIMSAETQKTITRYAALVDATNNTENAILAATAAGGNMNEFLTSLGGNFDTLDRKTNQFSKVIADIGNTTGLSSAQVSKYAIELMKVPGVMDQVVESHSQSGKKLNMLDAVLRVSRGTFQDYSEVIKDVTDITLNFGTSGDKALQAISRMYTGSQALGLRMVEMRDFVKTTGDQFKFFGDNTRTAVDVMATFAEPLRNTGIGGKAITQLVQDYTSGIARMGTAQKSFLAQQTGMGGGIQGALKIEDLLAKGDIGQVSEKLQEALKKQFGGNVMTREKALEGGENEARQFEMQRTFLQKGPFGSLASSPEAAAKLLEALSKGQTEEIAKQIGTGDEALTTAVNQGDELIERQTTELVEINNQIALVADLQAQTVAALAKETIGSESGFGERIQNIKKEATERVSNQKVISGEDNQGGSTTPEALSEFGGMIIDLAKDVMEGAKPADTRDAVKPQENTNVTIPDRAPPELNEITTKNIEKKEDNTKTAQNQQNQSNQGPKTEPLIINVMSEGQVIKMIKIQLDERTQQLQATDHSSPG